MTRALTTAMNIDSHQHFWRYDPVNYGWIAADMHVLRRDFLPDDLANDLRTSGMSASIAVQANQSEAETSFLLQLAQNNSRIAGVVGWVDLRSSDLRQRLRHFSRLPKLRGFRHIVQSEPDDKFLLREDFCNGVRLLSEFGFTYDILVYPSQLRATIAFAERLPSQKMVLDHLGKPPIKSREIREWKEHIKTLAQLPYVHCKVSGMVTEAEWNKWKASDFEPCLDVVFEAFGARRLMFGSDWPVCLLSGTYANVKEILDNYMSRFSESDREAVFGLNALRFYGLEARSGEFRLPASRVGFDS